jgi:hypothetical protein
MIHLFICDDITVSVHKQRDSDSHGGISAIPEIMIMGQALNIAVLLIVHTLSGISDIIRQNVEMVSVFGAPGEDPRFLCNFFGINMQKAEKLRTLRPGQMAVKNPRLFEKTVYATFSPPQIPDSCDELLRRQVVNDFYNKVKTTPPVPLDVFMPSAGPQKADGDKTTPAPELPPRGLDLMVLVHNGAPRPITKYYDQMSISRAAGAKLTQHMELLGFLRVHHFSTGKRGGKASLVEITPEGLRLLESKGFSRRKKKTGGDFEHDAATDLVEDDGRKKGNAATFEQDVGGLRVDVLLTDLKSGSKILVNIGVSNIKRECDSIQKFLGLPISRSTEFILVARDSEFARAIESELKARGIPIDTLTNVHMKLLADYLEF